MSNGISDEAIAAYAADLIDLEGRINELQDDKKGTYASVREAYGDRVAKSLKRAVALHRMDANKRTESDEIDAEADRFLSIIRSPRAPRATRTRDIIEEIPLHDADGVILETSSPATNHGGLNEYQGVAKEPISSTEAAKPEGLSAAVIGNDDMAAGAGSSAGGGSDVSASAVEFGAPHYEAAE